MKKKIKKSASLYALMFMLSLVAAGCGSEAGSERIDSSESIIESEMDDNIELKDTTIIKNKTINLDDYEGILEINDEGEYNIKGNLENGILYITSDEKVTIVLDNVTITNSDGPCIFIKNSKKVTFELKGENTLSETGNLSYNALNAAIYSKSDLKFEGDGVLNIITASSHAIKGKDSIIFDNGTFNITSKLDCINANEDLIINNGIYNLNAAEECLQSDTNIEINNGEFLLESKENAIKAESSVLINEGKIIINNANEGIESNDKIKINNGNISINSSDDCINAANSIEINDGEITVISSTNDAIDSNGLICINGGVINATGARMPEGAFDCDNNDFVINGGSVIGIGSANSIPSESSQNSYIFQLESITQGTLKITNELGKTIFSQKIKDASQISMPGLNGNLNINQNMRPDKNNGEIPEDGRFPGQDFENGEALEEMPEGDFNIKNPNFNKENMGINNQGTILFMSMDNLKDGEKYFIYLDGELLQEITISEEYLSGNYKNIFDQRK